MNFLIATRCYVIVLYFFAVFLVPACSIHFLLHCSLLLLQSEELLNVQPCVMC